MVKLKKITLGFLATALLTTLAHAVFILPSEITVFGRIDNGSLRTDVVRDGVDSSLYTPPELTLTGSAHFDVVLGSTYSEPGATCTDAADGSITVPAPVFSPALNVNLAGLYTATYTCTDSDNMIDTAQRTVAVGQEAPPPFGPQSSTFASTHGFDFVEEFDGLQDWNQSSIGRVGNQYDTDNLARMPKLANGSTSAWGYFSLWDTVSSTHQWIGGTQSGTRQVWRGTKSGAIDLGSTGNGPSRLGVYFGGANEAGGYKDISIFYMVYITPNQWPTSIAGSGGIGTYDAGQPYIWVSSWKLNNTELECNGTNCGDSYGLDYMTTLMKHDNYDLGIVQILNPAGQSAQRANDNPIRVNDLLGDWFGVEYRFTNNGTDTNYTAQVWLYAPDGTAYKTMDGHVFSINAEARAAGGRWDRFFFGGNNSSQWIWGPTMQSHYYVDDLIIDNGSKGQIGPRYFSAIGVTP